MMHLTRSYEVSGQSLVTAILKSFAGDRPDANVCIAGGRTSQRRQYQSPHVHGIDSCVEWKKRSPGERVSGAIDYQAQTQYSVHLPSQFICHHQDKLLPGWSCPARSMLIVLQSCSCDLLERSPLAEAQKRKLRRQFLKLGYAIAAQINCAGHTAALFDPRTGLPLLTRPGELRLDDVAIVQAALGYRIACSHGCSIVLHPTWGGAVYPSTLVSSAEPALVEHILRKVQEQ